MGHRYVREVQGREVDPRGGTLLGTEADRLVHPPAARAHILFRQREPLGEIQDRGLAPAHGQRGEPRGDHQGRRRAEPRRHRKRRVDQGVESGDRTVASLHVLHSGFDVVAPVAGGERFDLVGDGERPRCERRIAIGDPYRPVGARANEDPHPSLHGHRQHRKTGVVDVLADQVHATRRRDAVRGPGRAELVDEALREIAHRRLKPTATPSSSHAGSIVTPRWVNAVTATSTILGAVGGTPVAADGPDAR